MKLAERLARDIKELITAQVLEPGARLGSESDLAVQLGASRWSLREALGLLEQDGRIQIRRGRGGGIFVAEPGQDAAIQALWSYLEFIAVRDEEILDARAVIDRAVLALAIARLRIEDIPELRASIDREPSAEDMQGGIRQFQALLAVARNPLLVVLIRTMGQLAVNATMRSNLSDEDLEATLHETRKLRRAQIEAVIAGDLNAALAREAWILRHVRKLFDSARGGTANRERAVFMLGAARRYKRPQMLMHEIAADVVGRGLVAGEKLGSEAELLHRFGVSRSVFREAVRALEHSGIVEMRSGRHSGLYVVAPNPANTLATAQVRLAETGPAYRIVGEVLAAVVAGAVSLADAGGLRSVAAGGFLEVCDAIFRATGNRVLALFGELLTGLLAHSAQAAELEVHAPALAAACAEGDGPLASRIVLTALGGPQGNSLA